MVKLDMHFGKITSVVFTILIITVASIFYDKVFEQAEALPVTKQELLFFMTPLS